MSSDDFIQWAGAGFNHSLFPLVQGHSAVKCTDCHKTGSYTNASSECNSCHQQDYLATKNPNHSTSQFSTNCQDCHTLAAGWKPTSFNHTSFPLTLGHAAVACTACHTGGNYTSTPTDCYSCHKTDFLATTAPNHAASGIATTCQTCHTTNPGWKPTTFNHTVFPLTLGHATALVPIAIKMVIIPRFLLTVMLVTSRIIWQLLIQIMLHLVSRQHVKRVTLLIPDGNLPRLIIPFSL